MNTQILSSEITGNDYFSAYRSRMEANDRYFKKVAKELTELNYTVFIPNGRLINFLRVERAGMHLYFGFSDVPYRWYLSCDIDMKLKAGSSKVLKEIFDYDSPFSSKDIIENMQPNQYQTVKPAQYLSIFSI